MQLKEFIEIIEKNKIAIIRTWVNSSKIKKKDQQNAGLFL